MRLTLAEHLTLPWRVHALVPDFEILDVWRLPVRGRPDEAAAFFELADPATLLGSGTGLTRQLVNLRMWLGRVTGWDKEALPRPIPGCQETTVRARLPGGEDDLSPRSGAAFLPVYRDERETLLEISNSTIHALMHLGWVELADGSATGQMAVYIKSRGLSSRLYMAAIAPFRHQIVYPALLAAVERRWADRARAR